MINNLAEVYFTPKELKIISVTTGIDPQQLKFDDGEVEILLRRNNVQSSLTGVVSAVGETNEIGILQFYDFVRTIEDLLTHMRGVDMHIRNLSLLGNEQSIGLLKADILSTHWIPWELLATNADVLEHPETAERWGFPVGSETIATPKQLTREMQEEEKQISKDVKAASAKGDDAVDAVARAEARAKRGWKGAFFNAVGSAITLLPRLFYKPISYAMSAEARVSQDRVIRTLDTRFDVVPKGPYDRSCEEAFICGNRILGTITALSQGLFTVNAVAARKFTVDQENTFSSQLIQPGSWINTFDVDPAGTAMPPIWGLHELRSAIQQIDKTYTDGKVKPEYAQAADIVKDILDIDQKGFVKHLRSVKDHYILLPKVCDIAQYPRNTFWRLFDSVESAIPELYRYPVNGCITHKIQPTGGPIGVWIWSMIKPITQKKMDENSACYPWPINRGVDGQKEYVLPLSAKPLGGLVVKDEHIFLTAEQIESMKKSHRKDLGRIYEGAPGGAVHIDFTEVRDVMTRNKSHPIWACPRLADAFQQTRTGTTLLSMYGLLQRSFESALKQYSVYGSTGGMEARQFKVLVQKGLGVLPLSKCPNGTIPRYRDAEGAFVDQADATFIKDGVAYLKANIDPAQCDCVVPQRAPDVEVRADAPSSQLPMEASAMTVRQSPDRTDYDANDPSPSPIAGAMNVGPADIVTQVSANHGILKPTGPHSSSAAAYASVWMKRTNLAARTRAKATPTTQGPQYGVNRIIAIKGRAPTKSTRRLVRVPGRKLRLVVRRCADGHRQGYWVRR